MSAKDLSPVVDSATLRQYKKKFNFFETPEGLADRMAELIDAVGLNARVLEPSAGLGALIRAVGRAVKYPIAPVDFCEVQDEFTRVLEEGGARKVGGDFLSYSPGPIYDAIIMNPPYKGKTAEQHLNHAWDCLKPGGSVVALVGMNAVRWIDEEFLGHVFVRDEIPRKTFKETPVATCLYLINKPKCC